MHREIRTEVIVSGDDGGQLSVGANLVGMRVDGARGNAVTVLPAGSAPEITPRRYPIRLMPRRTVPFFDRVDETQQMLAELTVHRSVVLQAPPGVGKTSLVRHIAHHPGLAAAYGAVVCLSARDQSCEDLLQALFSAYYTSDGPVRPNRDELRHLLRPVQGAVLLDDVELPSGALAELQEFAPNCGFVLAGTHVNGARSGLSGLPVDAAGELLARVMGQPVDRTAVFALWGLSRGVPARLIQLGVSASAYPGGVEAFTELALHDGPPPFTVDAPEDRRLLGLLAAVPGVELTAEQLASIAEVPDAAPRLRRWVGRGVVTVSDAGLYRFAAGELDPVLWQLAERRAELVAAFATWARREPDTVLAVGGSAELVRSLQELALRQQAWRAVLALGAPLDAAYALAGHWDAWHSCLQAMLDAARALGDQVAEATALHQLGTEAICRGDLATARDLLRAALDLRLALGQTEAAEITRENLATITDQPRSAGFASPLARIPMAAKVVAVLIPLLGSLAFVGVSQARGTPKASFAPQRLAFTDQIVDHASAPQAIRLDNGGLAGLHVDGVVISGPNHGAFTLVGNSCVGEVPASGNCTAMVVFTPATPGPQQASLSWRIREIPGDMASPLVGNGVAPTANPGGLAPPSQVPVRPAPAPAPAAAAPLAPAAAAPPAPAPASAAAEGEEVQRLAPAARVQPTLPALAPSVVAFGEHAVTSVSGPLTVTVTNRGGAPVRLAGIVVDGDQAFQVDAGGCAAVTLGPGGACRVAVRFAPTGEGRRSGVLSVTVPDVPERAAVALSGFGIGQVPIPGVTGRPLADAQRAVEAVGLRLGTVTRTPSPNFAVGAVIGQTPTAGKTLPRGGAVNLVVSSGPEPIVVPLLVGRPQADAVARLDALGLRVGQVEQRSDPTIAAGAVVATSPQSGAGVPRGSAVNLAVSSGPQVTTTVAVPPVVGQSLAAARTLLGQRGLAVGAVTEQSSATVAEGVVIGSDPGAGAQVASGSRVSLVVSSGPQVTTVAVPSVVGKFVGGGAVVDHGREFGRGRGAAAGE